MIGGSFYRRECIYAFRKRPRWQESAYLYERRSSWVKEPVECTFIHEETKYTGHLDLADCCRAMMENVIRDDYESKELEQTVQSDSLKAQLG